MKSFLHSLFGCFWKREGSKRVCTFCKASEYQHYDYETGETYWNPN